MELSFIRQNGSGNHDPYLFPYIDGRYAKRGEVMIMKQTYLVIIVVAMFLCCMCIPAGAVMQEVTVKGAMATVNQPKNTLTIGHPQ
jgi:predicted signal transduction protein with EAL and GGDEF domain